MIFRRRDNTRKWRQEFRELHARLEAVMAAIGPLEISKEQAGEVASVQMGLKRLDNDISKRLDNDISEQIAENRAKGRPITELSLLAAEVREDRRRIRWEILR